VPGCGAIAATFTRRRLRISAGAGCCRAAAFTRRFTVGLHHLRLASGSGRGVVIEPEVVVPIPSRPERAGNRCVRLRCDCGNTYTERIAMLLSGKRTTCGSCKHHLVTHDLSRHQLYGTWHNMLRRCKDPRHVSYPRYGARGITVCPRWHDVTAFVEDIERILGPRPEGMTLDRIRNGLGYKPSNVRWATLVEQRRNRRERLRSTGHDDGQADGPGSSA
jgi:hypothetical protein